MLKYSAYNITKENVHVNGRPIYTGFRVQNL
jgi:hypothetical protein